MTPFESIATEHRRVFFTLFCASVLLLTSCATQRRTSAQGTQNPDQLVIDRLWEQTNKTIAQMGRSKRLYKVDPQKTALLVIDMQNAFCLPTGSIEIPDSRKIVPNINMIVTACRKADIPVYWLRMNITSGAKDNGLWPLFQPRSPISRERQDPPQALLDLGPDTEVIKELDLNEKEDTQVPKNRYSAFIRGASNLEKLLKDRGRDTLIITGLASDVCAGITGMDAMMLDFKVIFISDATTTVDPVFHEVYLMHLKMFFGDVVSTQEIINDLHARK